MRLYLDVETYRPRKEDAFIHETVIVIGVIEDWTPYRPESAKLWKEPSVVYQFFTLWEMNGISIEDKERKLITRFYEYFRQLVNECRTGRIEFLNVVGYGIASAAELNALWHNTFTVDYFQTTLPFHGMRFKDLKLELLVGWAKKAGIDVPEPYGSGRDVSHWYEEKQYENILKHLKRDLEIIRVIDLNFKKIYGALLESLRRSDVM